MTGNREIGEGALFTLHSQGPRVYCTCLDKNVVTGFAAAILHASADSSGPMPLRWTTQAGQVGTPSTCRRASDRLEADGALQIAIPSSTTSAKVSATNACNVSLVQCVFLFKLCLR